MKIYTQKIAKKISDKDMPSNDILATYVEALKLFLKQYPHLNVSIKKAIENLPSPTKIRSELSHDEIVLLYETIDWAWKKITQHDIIDELKVKSGPKHLMGNYWILQKGLIIQGENHFTTIKNNINLFSSLLNISANTLLNYMGSEPNKVIFCAIANGAIRLYINTKGEIYCQMSESTYAKWGKKKIQKLDFSRKIVKVIDIKQPYKGWSTGVVVKL